MEVFALLVALIAIAIAASASSRARRLEEKLARLQAEHDKLSDAALWRVQAIERRLWDLWNTRQAVPQAPAENATATSPSTSSTAPVPAPVPDSSSAPTTTPTTTATTTTTPNELEPELAAAAIAARPDLEQWLGARGAAALGAAVLVLAGVYFFKYSIEHGIIGPGARVAIGLFVAAGCVVAAETTVRKRHDLLAGCLSGAGCAIAYLTIWAATALYRLFSPALAWPLMLLVTAGCCALSFWRKSGPIAVMGLLGGFATPLLLSTGEDRPIALFAYLLLLDGALLVVSIKNRWPALAAGSLLGTLCYQGMWIGLRMDRDRLGLGMLLPVAFGALFVAAASKAAAPAQSEDEAASAWRPTLAAAALAPFAFALCFGVESKLSLPLWQGGLYLLVLLGGGLWSARRLPAPALGIAASAAATGVFASWLFARDLATGEIWQAAGVAVGIALVLGAAAEFERRVEDERRTTRRSEPRASNEELEGKLLEGKLDRKDAAGLAHAQLVWTLGTLATTAFAALAQPLVPTPWIVAWAALALLGLRRGVALGLAAAVVAPAALDGAALFFLSIRAAFASTPAHPLIADARAAQIGYGGVAHAAGWLLATRLARRKALRIAGADGAALVAALLLLASAFAEGLTPAGWCGLIVALAAIGALAARSSRASWLFAIAIPAAISTWLCAFGRQYDAATALLCLGVAAAVVALLSLWPLYTARHRGDRNAWRAPAVTPLLFLWPALYAWRLRFDGHAHGLVPLGLALPIGCTALGLRGRTSPEPAVRTSALAWTVGSLLALVTIAVPLQLEREWWTIGWALQGAALLALWRRVDHAGLKYTGAGLLAVAFVRLVPNPWLLSYHPRGWPIINWLAYTYLVPAAAMFAGSRALAPIERPRLRPWESAAFAARGLAVATLVTVFFWINLAVVDAFGHDRVLSLRFDHDAARDLTLSLAWALYGMALLALGVWRGSAALRKTSLAVVLATCAKVFLYDLSELRDLYRVFSLVGLALSLIAISLGYKRFVLAGEPETARSKS